MSESKLLELVHVPDIFVSGIGRIEKLPGGMVRVIFYTEQFDQDGKPERVVVAKIVRPSATLGEALRLISRHLTHTTLIAEDGEVKPLDS